jgi:hypothetical protein
MGDSSEIFEQLDKFVRRRYLYSIPFILDHIDYVVRKSRGNRSVEEVYLYVYALVGQDDEFWDKVGQVIGNLQALGSLHITPNYRDGDGHDDEEGLSIFESEILARILRHVRQKVTLIVTPHEDEYRVVGLRVACRRYLVVR